MSTLILTTSGEQQALNTQRHDADFAVLSLLYETGGPVDFEEVMSKLHTDEVKASLIVRRLINQGFVQEV